MPELPSKELLQHQLHKGLEAARQGLGKSSGGLTTKDYFAKQEKICIFAK